MGGGVLGCCIQTGKWFPVVFISAVLVWSYYAYVLQLCIFTVDSVALKVVFLAVYHPVLFVFCWAYYKTTMTPSAAPPQSFFLSPRDGSLLEGMAEEEQRRLLEQYVKDLPVLSRSQNGVPRYCEQCKCIKPDRGHHCSVCSQCVLKMDHHCPWVNNCVGFSNYKFFVLFLGYGVLYTLWVATTSGSYFVKFWTNELTGEGRFHILFLFFAAVMFAISLLGLFGYHLFLTVKNRSTLESFRPPMFSDGPDPEAYDLGKLANFEQVFGTAKVKWFLPVFTSLGSGVMFPCRQGSSPLGHNYQSVDTAPSQGSGITFPIQSTANADSNLLGRRESWTQGDHTQSDSA